MDASTFMALVLTCAPQVNPSTAHALVSVESAFNPWAIGVVGGVLVRQPQTHAEALATARELQALGHNFSVGLGQINRGNFSRLGLTTASAFNPCLNLSALQSVLAECFDRARGGKGPSRSDQHALRMALSCYYSGNFSTGFRHGYVQKVLAAARTVSRSHPNLVSKESS